MSHSPGPWTSAGDEVVDAHGQSILGRHWSTAGEDGYDWDTLEANARIAAAAPELLAMLRAMVDDGSDDGAEVYMEARALLARIEGPQPP